MPSDEANLRAYAFFISPAGERAETLCGVLQGALRDRLTVRPWWDKSPSGGAPEAIVDHIRDARVVLADLRGARPNVYYEIGLAHAFEIPVVLFGGDEDAHFNLGAEQRIQVADDVSGLPMKDLLGDEVRKAIDALPSEPARTAVSASNRRREAAAAERAGQTPSGEGAIHSDREAGGVWRDLALTGGIPPLTPGDLFPDVRVLHTEYGLGRIRGHSPVSGESISVTIAFGTAIATLLLSDPRLFRAEIRPRG
jgi:hypothetical protein